MNLELYKFFYFVAKAGNISRAAEMMYISQPAVTKSIKALENELGCPLFLRSKRGVTLTAQGQTLYNAVEKAFNFLSIGEKQVAELQNLTAGELRIGVSDTICRFYLLPLLKVFHAKFPAIKIEVVCPTTPEIIRLLKAGAVDLGIVNLPIEDKQVEIKRIMGVQDCFVCGETYRALSMRYLSIAELAEEYPLILLEKASNSRLFMDNYFRANGVEVAPAFELGNMDMLIHFAKNDMGISCVIRNFIEDELEKETLFEVKVSEKIPPRSIGAVWLSGTPLSPAARELTSFIEYEETYEF